VRKRVRRTATRYEKMSRNTTVAVCSVAVASDAFIDAFADVAEYEAVSVDADASL
jgi:hypothetical protein